MKLTFFIKFNYGSSFLFKSFILSLSNIWNGSLFVRLAPFFFNQNNSISWLLNFLQISSLSKSWRLIFLRVLSWLNFIFLYFPTIRCFLIFEIYPCYFIGLNFCRWWWDTKLFVDLFSFFLHSRNTFRKIIVFEVCSSFRTNVLFFLFTGIYTFVIIKVDIINVWVMI